MVDFTFGIRGISGADAVGSPCRRGTNLNVPIVQRRVSTHFRGTRKARSSLEIRGVLNATPQVAEPDPKIYGMLAARAITPA